jgi:hypothetical protein
MVPSGIPATMAAVTTSTSGTNVEISWVPPSSNGAAILTYKILLQHADGSFAEDVTLCDGSDSLVISDLYCSIPMSALRAAPYSLT